MSKDTNSVKRAVHAIHEAGSTDYRLVPVLSRLVHWMPYAEIEFDDRWWVAKTHDQLVEETEIKKRTVKDHLAELRRLGVIETEYKMFGNKRTSHHTVKSIAPDETSHRSDVLHVLPVGRTVRPTGRTPEGGPSIELDSNKTLTVQKPRTAAEVVAAGIGRTVEEMFSDRPTPTNLARVWEISWRKAFPGVPVSGFDAVKGNLVRAFARECDEPARAIHLAVTLWPEFSSVLEGAPRAPSLAALHRNVALLNKWVERKTRPPKFVDGMRVVS